jgi:hypothetical protein
MPFTTVEQLAHLEEPEQRVWAESADVDKTSTMVVGSPTLDGAIVLVRLKDLERGRYYRLELLYGTAPNRRGSGLLIHCEE